MATVYLRSTDGNDADDGSTWALAKATLVSAITAAGTGGLIYVSKSHSETYASATAYWTFGGSSAADTVLVLAVDDSGDPEPPTTLVKGTDATHPIFNMSTSDTCQITGYFYLYGIELQTPSSGVNARFSFGTGSPGSTCVLEDCYYNGQATGSTAQLQVGNSTNSQYDNSIVFRNLTLKLLSGVSGSLAIQNAVVVFEGGSFTPGGTSNSFIEGDIAADRTADITFRDFDLSAIGSGQYLVGDVNQGTWSLRLERCKLPATFNFTEWPSVIESYMEPPIRATGCHTDDGFYDIEHQGAMGSVTTDTAIDRVGGASYDGTNLYSILMSTGTAVEERRWPMRFKLWEGIVDLTSAVTFTVHTCQDDGTVLQDDDFWIEVEHPDSTDLALGVSDNSSKVGLLATAANLTASSETWNGASGSEDKRQVAVTISAITGASVVPVTVWANLAKPSTDLNVCPKVEQS